MQGIGNDNNYKKKSEILLKQNIIPLTIIITHGVFAHNCFLQLFEPEKDVVFVDFGALTLAERRLQFCGLQSLFDQLKTSLI
jgi:hypothetical protein